MHTQTYKLAMPSNKLTQYVNICVRNHRRTNLCMCVLYSCDCIHECARFPLCRGVALKTREGGDAVCDGTTTAFMVLDNVAAAVSRNTSSSSEQQPFVKVFASAAGTFAATHGDGSGSFLLCLVASLEEAQRYLDSCSSGNVTDKIRITSSRRERINLVAALRRVRAEVLSGVIATAARQCTFTLHASSTSSSLVSRSSLEEKSEKDMEQSSFIGIYTCLVHTVLASVPREEKKAVSELVLKLKTMQRKARSIRFANQACASNDPRESQDVRVCVSGGGSGSITCAALTGVLMDRPLRHAHQTTKSGQADVSVALMTGRLFDELDIDEYDRFHNGTDVGGDDEDDSESDEDGFHAVADDMTQFAALSLSGKTYRVRSARDGKRGFSSDTPVPSDTDTDADVHTNVRTGDEHVRVLLRLLGSLQVDLLVTTQRFHESLVGMITNAGIGVVSGVRADDFDTLRREMRISGNDGSMPHIDVITDALVMQHVDSARGGGGGAAHVRRRCSVMEYAMRGSADKFVCISNTESMYPSLSALVCGPTRCAAKCVAAQIQRCWTVLANAERADGGLEVEIGGFCMELIVAHLLRHKAFEMRHAGEAPAMQAAIHMVAEAVLAPIRRFLFSASRGVRAHTDIVARRQLSERLRAMDTDNAQHLCSLIVRRCTPCAAVCGLESDRTSLQESRVYDAMSQLTHSFNLATASVSGDTGDDDVREVADEYHTTNTNQGIISSSQQVASRTSSELTSSVAVWNTIRRHLRDVHDIEDGCDMHHLSWGILHPSQFFSSKLTSVLETALLAIGTEELPHI